nr:hypothetical protein [bacterium]
MKKVSLLTLATATFISSMASAQMYQGNNSANMITPSLSNMENPMYKPMEGKFYSKTNFNYTPVDHHDDSYALTEEFGYGISQDWAISAAIGYGWMSKDANFYGKDSQVSNMTIGGLYRPVANQDLVWDITAGVSIDIADDMVDQYSITLPIEDYGKKDTGVFIGTKLGLNLGQDFIMAFNAGYMYDTDDKKDYDKKELGDTSYWNMGVEGQLVFSDDWSMNIAYKYKKFIDKDGFDKADSSNVVVSGNWQATDMAMLTLYVDYDATGKSNRLDAHS